MQISHESDKIAQVTFGTKSSRTARMADSAAFFHILSASLYSNPMLATVREIICNAADAHLQAGVTKPIQITIGEQEEGQGEYLVVRDFGLGIPDDTMDDIYLVFGDSTKKDDSGATGGFGLGSKAPWAVVDQFTVISNHAGTKTIYTLIKSDPDNDGKPSIQVMFSGPTTDTGLEVRVPINLQCNLVHRYVDSIVHFGDIAAELAIPYKGHSYVDFKRIHTLGLPNEAGSLTLVPYRSGNSIHRDYWGEDFQPHNAMAGNTSGNVTVRYGTVIYPVAISSERLDLPYVPDHIWIVQAPPDSLTLQPSRETLVYTETTINTLKMLEGSAMNAINSIPNYGLDVSTLLNKMYDENEPVLGSQSQETPLQRKILSVFDSCTLYGETAPVGLHEVVASYLEKGTPVFLRPAIHSLTAVKLQKGSRAAVKSIWKKITRKILESSGRPANQAKRLASVLINKRHDITNYRSVNKAARKHMVELHRLTRASIYEHSAHNGIEKLALDWEPSLINILTKRVTIIRVNGDVRKGIRMTDLRVYLKTTSARFAKDWEKKLKAAGWDVEMLWEVPLRNGKEVVAPKPLKVISKKEGFLCLSAGVAPGSVHGGWYSTVRAVDKVRDAEDQSKYRIQKPIAYVRGRLGQSTQCHLNLSTVLYRHDGNGPQLDKLCDSLALVVNASQEAAAEKAGVQELSSYLKDLLKDMDDNTLINFCGSTYPAIFIGTVFDEMKERHKLSRILEEAFPSPRAKEAGELGIALSVGGNRVRHATASYVNGKPPGWLYGGSWITQEAYERIHEVVKKAAPTIKKFVDAKAVLNAIYEGEFTYDYALKTYFE